MDIVNYKNIKEIQSQIGELQNTGIDLTARASVTALQADLVSKARSSTRVVATSNSLNKLGADYICDGTNDAVVIRNALHAVIGIGDGGESFGWTHVQSTPVVPDLDFPFFWHDGTTFHAYGSYDSNKKIGHATSLDGISWVMDTAHNPILTTGSAGSYDDTYVAVFCPWIENGTWRALYRANGIKIAYATSPDGVTWTKYAGNPVINDGASSCDPAGIIKDGSTYYLYTNTTGGDRQIIIWTSTDLTTWTKPNATPTWRGGRYCSAPFKFNSKFYLIVSKQYEGGRGSLLELWEDTTPLFTYGSRKFLGIVVYGRNWVSVDTPSVLTTTIQRDVFYNNEFWCYYAKTVSGYSVPDPAFLLKEPTIAGAIAKAVLPNMNGEVLLSEGTIILKDESTPKQSIGLDYGITLRGLETVIKLDDSFNQLKDDRGVISVDQDCLLKNVTLDGNTEVATLTKMLHISNNAKTEGVNIKNCKATPYIVGNMIGSKIYSNSCITTVTESGKIIDSDVFANTGSAALKLSNKARAIDCEVHDNTSDGIDANDDAFMNRCYTHNNGRYGAYLKNRSLGVECQFVENKTLASVGAVLADTSALINPLVRDNYKGITTLAGSNASVRGGDFYANARWAIESTGSISVSGARFSENVGYSNNGQIYLGAKSRVVSCEMEASTTQQRNQIQVATLATGSTIGNNKLVSGSVGFIELISGATVVTYNNEEI